jgi:hypothetical protein
MLHSLSWILDAQGQERSVEVARESRELLRVTGDRGLEQRGVIALVQTLLSLARLEDAKEAMDASPDPLDAQIIATWLGDIALREDKPADAVPQYARSLEHALRAGNALQAMNDSVGVAVGLLRAGFIEAGMEAAGALAALAAETGHGGFGSWGESFGFAGTVETARSAAGADAAFERGGGSIPASASRASSRSRASRPLRQHRRRPASLDRLADQAPECRRTTRVVRGIHRAADVTSIPSTSAEAIRSSTRRRGGAGVAGVAARSASKQASRQLAAGRGTSPRR